MVQILVAPAAFKGTFAASDIASAISRGLHACSPQYKLSLAPIADGGDGIIETIQATCGGERHQINVLDAVGREHGAYWLKIGDEGLVELAQASGISLLAEEDLAPMACHTFGLGQVILDCLKYQPENLFVGLGGSASTDGGTGALMALGVRFFDKDNHLIREMGGKILSDIDHCDASLALSRRGQTVLHLLVDVENPLYGENGAAYIYAPQKGATADQIKELDRGLRHFADVLEREFHCLRHDTPGSGAAGGTAFGLSVVFGADMQSGFDWVVRKTDLDSKIEDANLVISAEGRIDRQSLFGKGVGRLIKRCRQAQKPVWILTASIGDGLSAQDLGVAKLTVVAPDSGSFVSLDKIEQAIKKEAALIQQMNSPA